MADTYELPREPLQEPLIAAALAALAEAERLAQTARRPPWDFALDLEALGQVGARQSHLRWLIAEGLVEQRIETTRTNQAARVFRPAPNLAFCTRTCFMLTEAGRGHVEQAPHLLQHPRATVTGNGAEASPPERPCWDRDARELRYGLQVIKRYRVPAPNQEAVLVAFEAAGWPRTIDDPLADHFEQDRKQRLSHAIKALNRLHRVRLIHFHGDGTGRRVSWAKVDV